MSRRQRSARRLLESSIETIDRLIRIISRRHQLPNEAVPGFRSHVFLRLMEDDYRILRSHSGRAALQTFLSATVSNLARDYRRRLWGRWKPSAAALRLGCVAVELEMLVGRDEMPLGEAIQTLLGRHGTCTSERRLRALHEDLPRRCRRRAVDPDRLGRLPAADRADGMLAAEGRIATARRLEAVLVAALRRMAADDRELVRLRFGEGASIAAIARMWCVESSRLYRRLAACMGELRRALHEAGLDAEDAVAVIGRGEIDLRVPPLRSADPRTASATGMLVA